MKPLAFGAAFLLTAAGLAGGCGGSLSVGFETEGGTTTSACAAAGGTCIPGEAKCASPGVSSAQDCNTSSPNPGGAYCCLGLADAGDATADTGSGPDASPEDKDAFPTLDANSVDAIPEDPVCSLADKNVQWVIGNDAGTGPLDCTQPTVSEAWAVGMGVTWEDVFLRQCETALTSPTCAQLGLQYYSCVSTTNPKPSCRPCAQPNAGECKASDGVTLETGCGSEEEALAMCLCGNANSCIW